jgi:hypothetical protein
MNFGKVGFRSLWRWWRLTSIVLMLAMTAPVVLPKAWQAIEIWRSWNEQFEIVESRIETVSSDDPEELTAYHLRDVPPARYGEQIGQALDDGDFDLAISVADLARQRGIKIPPELAEKLDAIQPDSLAVNIWDGVRGESDTVEGLAAEIAADLFVIGDIRDLVKQVGAIPNQDNVVIALAAAGLVGTVATAVSAGGTLPAKFGISILKVAKRTGKLNVKFMDELLSLTARAIDLPALREVASRAKKLDWTGAAAASGKILDKKVLDQLTNTGATLGTIASTRGPKATLKSLEIAESMGELATLGKISNKSGNAYRGILTMSGGKILKPIVKVNRIKKTVQRGAMAFTALAELVGWLLTGVLWVVSASWTVAKLSWRLLRPISGIRTLPAAAV